MKAKDLRKGSVIIYNNNPYKVMDFHHHTPGNLKAMIQTKLRNLKDGSQTEARFSSSEDVPEAPVFTFNATVMYSDVSGVHFMNNDSYEEVVVELDVLGDQQYYLKEGMDVQIMDMEGLVLGISLPPSVVLEVVETEPGMKSATVTAVLKPAKTDTGLTVGVPAFVNAGDKIVVSTDDGSYMKRAE